VDEPAESQAETVQVCVESTATVEEPVAEMTVVETESQPEVQSEAGVEVELEAAVDAESLPVSEAVVEEASDIVIVENVEIAEDAMIVEAAQPEAELPAPEAEEESNDAIIREIISLTKDGKADEAAYDEYLKDAAQPVLVNEETLQAEPAQEETLEPAVVKNEIKVELDTKNAHVWNELGNVYFNSGAYEEAITAYGKAIELDTYFAWPYSNLALAYVQKEKYAEAVLLYQRSIELFSSDKDKAVTWNRLGNVYRRMNDYENAIASYQRADELDPNNATRSLRSRFSLLGSFNMEQSPSFAA
jgi:tetratricopeptide (TPR) repeat protein